MRPTWAFAFAWGLLTAAPRVSGATISKVSGATIYLCGDSTMAPNGGGGQTDGWGQYLQENFAGTGLKVQNMALAGRSVRSYTREGKFADVAAKVKPGDWVLISFGHNDGGRLQPVDDGRTDCPGDGAETCQTTYKGVPETVQTYPAYLKQAATMMLSAGAKVVLASPTPNNVWEGGTYAWGPNRFNDYTAKVVADLGGTANGIYFVDHGSQSAQAMKNLGSEFVNENYPKDHTHPSPLLSKDLAGAFVLALKCGTSDLGKAIVNSTESLKSSFLGDCTQGNKLSTGCSNNARRVQIQ